MILEKNNLVLRGKSVFLWTLGAIEVERRGEAVGGPFEKLVPWLSSLVEVGTVLQKPGPDDGDVGAFLPVVPSSHTDPDHQIRYRQTSRKTSGFGAKMHVRPIGFKTPPPRSSRHDFK